MDPQSTQKRPKLSERAVEVVKVVLLFYDKYNPAATTMAMDGERVELSNGEYLDLLCSVGANAARIAGMLDMAMLMLGQE